MYLTLLINLRSMCFDLKKRSNFVDAKILEIKTTVLRLAVMLVQLQEKYVNWRDLN